MSRQHSIAVSEPERTDQSQLAAEHVPVHTNASERSNRRKRNGPEAAAGKPALIKANALKSSARARRRDEARRRRKTRAALPWTAGIKERRRPDGLA